MFDREIRDRVDRLELPWGEFGMDPYGVSKRHLEVYFGLLAPLYRHYFSVEARGIGNVPKRGRAMLIGNHSGGVAIDGAMIIASMLFEMDPPRLAQGMVEKFLNAVPIASQWLNRTGQFTGLPEHAIRLLEDDRLLMIFPEGARGTAKLYKERYSLVAFGTGFMRLALRTKTPIVPVAFLGGGDAIPTVANSTWLGKLVGAPYVPITPYGIAFPLPVKLEVVYGEPMVFEGTGAEEDVIITGYVERVKAEIAQMLEEGRRRRRAGSSGMEGAR